MADYLDPDDLSTQVKRAAEKQLVAIELTEEQLEMIRAVWDEGDPKAPAKVTFLVRNKPVAELSVAGYRYRGDTCCV